MRQLGLGLALALSLAAILSLSGCATASPQTETDDDEFAEYIAELRELPGVDQVDLNSNEQTSAASLSVQVSAEVASDALVAIGETSVAFTEEAESHGFTASAPVIRIGESTYSYFDELTADQVGEQLVYWLGLQHEGVDSVQMRTYTSLTSVPAQGTLGEHTSDQPPRYVLVTLPTEVDEEALRNMIEGLAAIPDPGAPGGQWDFYNLAPRTKGEYAEPGFPSTTDLSYAVTTGNHFADVNGLANVEVLRDAGHDTPLQIRIAVFDDAMDGVGSDSAEATFQGTQAWTHLLGLVSLLESAGSLDYGVEVLANPLSDGGNFQLEFEVHGCEFETDEDWPALAEALTATWQVHAAEERFESDSTCELPAGQTQTPQPTEAGHDTHEHRDHKQP